MKALKCDNCGCDIPIVTKKLFDKEIKVFDTGEIHLKEWNIENLFVDCDLCKPCAKKISMALDYELLKTKIEVSTTQ